LDVNFDTESENIEFGALWSFTPDMHLDELWAQRSFLSLCSGMPKDLGIVRGICWIQDFKTWMTSYTYSAGRKGRYPVVPEQNFNKLVMKFVNDSKPIMDYSQYMWIRDGVVLAWYASFDVNIPQNASSTEVNSLRQKWDAYFDKWRSDAPKTAKGEGKGAWHTSPLWARAQATTATLSGLVASVVIAGIVAIIGIFAFTCSPAHFCRFPHDAHNLGWSSLCAIGAWQRFDGLHGDCHVCSGLGLCCDLFEPCCPWLLHLRCGA